MRVEIADKVPATIRVTSQSIRIPSAILSAGATLLSSRQSIEDCAHSLVIESQPETVFVRKLLYLRLSMFFVERPKALQVRLVNGAMLPFAALQFAFDLAREFFHTATQMV